MPYKEPNAPRAQQSTFLIYKNKNTVKTLFVQLQGGGEISYVSPLFGGSASDRQIVDRSNLFSMCDSMPKDLMFKICLHLLMFQLLFQHSFGKKLVDRKA